MKEEVALVLEEEQNMSFKNENLPIRLMFSKFIRFQEDKKIQPNVFCWVGFHATPFSPNIDF